MAAAEPAGVHHQSNHTLHPPHSKACHVLCPLSALPLSLRSNYPSLSLSNHAPPSNRTVPLQWHAGRVVQYDTSSTEHYVQYHDGDKAWLDFKFVRHAVLWDDVSDWSPTTTRTTPPPRQGGGASALPSSPSSPSSPLSTHSPVQSYAHAHSPSPSPLQAQAQAQAQTQASSRSPYASPHSKQVDDLMRRVQQLESLGGLRVQRMAPLGAIPPTSDLPPSHDSLAVSAELLFLGAAAGGGAAAAAGPDSPGRSARGVGGGAG